MWDSDRPMITINKIYCVNGFPLFWLYVHACEGATAVCWVMLELQCTSRLSDRWFDTFSCSHRLCASVTAYRPSICLLLFLHLLTLRIYFIYCQLYLKFAVKRFMLTFLTNILLFNVHVLIERIKCWGLLFHNSTRLPSLHRDYILYCLGQPEENEANTKCIQKMVFASRFAKYDIWFQETEMTRATKLKLRH